MMTDSTPTDREMVLHTNEDTEELFQSNAKVIKMKQQALIEQIRKF